MESLNLRTLLKPLRDCNYVAPNDSSRTINEIAEMVKELVSIHGLKKVEYAVNEVPKEYKSTKPIVRKSSYLKTMLERLMDKYELVSGLYEDDIVHPTYNTDLEKFDGLGFSVDLFIMIYEDTYDRKPTLDEILNAMDAQNQRTLSRIQDKYSLTNDMRTRLIKQWNEDCSQELIKQGYSLADTNIKPIPTLEEQQYGSKGI